ncbi:MAG: ATP-binding protein [bacterium]
MKYFSQSAFSYIRKQVERHSGSNNKLMFMLPGLPPPVVWDMGDRLMAFCNELPNTRLPLVKVAAPLVEEWLNSKDHDTQKKARKVVDLGWRDEQENLTGYRNHPPVADGLTVMLLIGVDRVTDSSSMADFHHCDPPTIWKEELGGKFSSWICAVLDNLSIGYENDTVEHFNSILNPLVERGLADVLQISTLLEELHLSAAQDGRDAEKVLLSSLKRFGLPDFGAFKFTGKQAFRTYIDDAVSFFSYTTYLNERNRKKALDAIDKFEEHNPGEELFDPTERRTFSTDEEFIEALRKYIHTADETLKKKLLACDFVTIRDRVLNFRAPKETKPRKETVIKLNGGPIEVILTALWATMDDFKRAANDRGVFAQEALRGIRIQSTLFKHDCDGESGDLRDENARVYLKRLLGGVDCFIKKSIDTSCLCSDSRSVPLQSQLFREDLECKPARTAEPALEFEIRIDGGEWDVVKPFAWRLPEIQPYRIADELLQRGADILAKAEGYCLPVFHVPYYEELMLAKDHEEVHRILKQCLNEDGGEACNLLAAENLDPDDPLLPLIRELAIKYGRFLKSAKTDGLHAALLDRWDDLRKAYEKTCHAYLNDSACRDSSLGALLFRSFLIVKHRPPEETKRWMWEEYEPSCAVTVLHPALLEMLQAHILFLLTSFLAAAKQELKSPGTRSFRRSVWQNYVDLATIQMPLSGLIKDRNHILDTDVRGENLIHRIGSVGDAEAPMSTRMLLRYDSFDEEDVSDTQLFQESRESALLGHILKDYRMLHPHADDGLRLAVYQNQDIQPCIAAIDGYLKDVCVDRTRPYAMAVTFFTETSDESGVARWLDEWKERWEAVENQGSRGYYRQVHLSIAHRMVSPDNNYQQFTDLVKDGLEVDIAILNGFIRAGSQGNDFVRVGPYDVTTRALKFPILEKSFCAFRDPGRKLRRARILSNRQFRITTWHAELMARLKNRQISPDAHHVVLGYGDYTPWQRVVDALHQRAEWIVCIDPNVDIRLIAEKGNSPESPEAREIIGFGSGVGAHGESNYTISTEQFRLSDILHKLTASIREVYSGWDRDTYSQIAQSILKESQHISGLSLVRATGIGTYIHDFMAYSLTRKLLQAADGVLCDQLVSLDAYRHWFDFAEEEIRPDLLWLTVRMGEDDRFHLDLRLIECKLAQTSDWYVDKARVQLENGLRHLIAVFMPHAGLDQREDERPDQRYWWLQLHRLIVSNSGIARAGQERMLTALERLAEGDYDAEWRAAAVTYWTDQASPGIAQTDTWPFSVEGQELGIGMVSAGSEFVRCLCETGTRVTMPWEGGSVAFYASRISTGEEMTGGLEELNPDEVGEHAERSRPAEVTVPPVEEVARMPEEDTAIPVEPVPRESQIPGRILLGTAFPGSRQIYWEFGHNGLNNRHLLIFGSSGMGKTYTIQCLLAELGRNGQNSLIVDYSNSFPDNQLEEEFKNLVNPLQHVVRKEPLAINPFRQQCEIIGEELLPEPPSTTAQRISGVFSEVYSFGDQQKSALYQAVKSCLERTGGAEMTLKNLIPRLERLAEGKGPVSQAATSVISRIRPFVDQNPFGAEDPGSWERLFTDTDHRCHIIQLAGFIREAARLVTEFSLIDLYWFYHGHGTQDSPHVIVLDEVQNLDHRDESPLALLLREGRRFGFSLILATQIMSNLGKDEKDRLFNAAHKLFFRPADTEIQTYAEIAAVTTNERKDVWLKRLAALKKGECYSLGPSLNEATRILETKAFRIRITSLEDRLTRA